MAKAKVSEAGGARQAVPAPKETGISAIGVEGFKSIRKKTQIAIRPLTILAGANSSGKSSMMQPVLLMKQTLDATYDPGALLLDGPHVAFTAADQLLTWNGGKAAAHCSFGVDIIHGARVVVRFDKRGGGGFDVAQLTERRADGREVTVRPGFYDYDARYDVYELEIRRERCFLVSHQLGIPSGVEREDGTMEDGIVSRPFGIHRCLRELIHVPAWRGTPARTYKTTAFGEEFSGTFEPYVASIIHHWQTTRDIRLEQLGAALQQLGLNWKIDASRVDDTRVELRVGRLKNKTTGGARDLVSIADVGFGVRQCLPVLVALLAARPGQLVYIEEPEIHLHPRAQVALAQILADAANRGVRVVIETHSSLLLLGIQALVAEGALAPRLVALHWFSLTKDGATEVRSTDLDDTGAFGDWPEDFADVTVDAQTRYLDAAEKRLAKAKR